MSIKELIKSSNKPHIKHKVPCDLCGEMMKFKGLGCCDECNNNPYGRKKTGSN